MALPEYEHILVYKILKGETADAIAADLDMSRDEVKRQLQEILARLRDGS